MIFFEDIITTFANMCVCDSNCDCWGCSCDANCDN